MTDEDRGTIEAHKVVLALLIAEIASRSEDPAEWMNAIRERTSDFFGRLQETPSQELALDSLRVEAWDIIRLSGDFRQMKTLPQP